MKRSTQILWGVLCAGVLLMGMGTGMAFATYAGFEYDAKSLMQEADPQTAEHTVKVPKDGAIEVWNYGSGLKDVVYSKSVPVDELRIELTYDSAYVGVDVEQSTDGDIHYVNIIPLYEQDDFQLFMQNKDAVLEGLKNGVLMDYDPSSLYDVQVTVYANPANKDRLYI